MIARHDADDWSVQNRIERQVVFLRDHPSVDLCGSFALDVHPDGTMDLLEREVSDARIKVDGMFRMPLLTTTTMGRRPLFHKYGCEDLNAEKCGDYCLYAQYFEDYRFANLPEVLMYKQVHRGSATGSQFDVVRKWDTEARKRVLRKLGLNPNVDQEARHERLTPQSKIEKRRTPPNPAIKPDEVEEWIGFLVAANKNGEKSVFEPGALDSVLTERLSEAFRIEPGS